jgi:hypothetical protein
MHVRRSLAAAAVLAVLALAATAVPAFTADNGTITVSITAQAAVAPCVTVSPGTVDFGTLPFSTDDGAGLSQGSSDITVGFCGSASGQNLMGSTTNASSASGAWTPQPLTTSIDVCPATDRFMLGVFGFTTPQLVLTGTPAPVLGSLGGPPAVFPAGDKVFRMTFYMPCQGSNGAGETKTLTTTFTAVVA